MSIFRKRRYTEGLRKQVSGIKAWFIPGTEFTDLQGKQRGILTPYAAKERRRRRRAGQLSRASRGRNAALAMEARHKRQMRHRRAAA